MYQTHVSTFKRMVYAFYYSDDISIQTINEIHFKILERYINIFDEIVFCIIIDNINNKEVIREIEKRVISIRNGDVIFKIYENSNYRECDVFYNEIVLKMKDLHGMTFFGHSKGSGVLDKIEETVAIVTALYYFSLENVENIEKYPFYGSLKMINNSPSWYIGPKYMWFYVGTFFWGDYQRIYYEKNNMPLYSSRWFDEMFPGNLYSHEECGSFCEEYIDATIKPLTPFDLIERIHGANPIMEKYILFYNDLMELIL